MYSICRNQAAASYSPICFFIFLSNFQTLKFFVTLFLGTVRPKYFSSKLRTGWMYSVYSNQAAVATYLSLCFFIFLSLMFNNKKNMSYFSQEL